MKKRSLERDHLKRLEQWSIKDGIYRKGDYAIICLRPYGYSLSYKGVELYAPFDSLIEAVRQAARHEKAKRVRTNVKWIRLSRNEWKRLDSEIRVKDTGVDFVIIDGSTILAKDHVFRSIAEAKDYVEKMLQ